MLYYVRIEASSGVALINSFEAKDKEDLLPKIADWMQDRGPLGKMKVLCVPQIGTPFTIVRLRPERPPEDPVDQKISLIKSLSL